MNFNTKRAWGPEPKYPHVLGAQGVSELITIAGPCAIESAAQVDAVISAFGDNKPTYMRGGVYRAGTYPPPEVGLKRDMLQMWAFKAHAAGLKIIVECLDVRLLNELLLYADAIQIGARAMQNYALLEEAAKLDMPVFLKRHHGATLDEFLGAAEYLARGRCKPRLIERGGVSFLNHTRWELSVSMIAAIKRMTAMPVIVDASHGGGRADLVQSLTLAGIAAGADGFLVEIHPNPEASLSDKEQALPLSAWHEICEKSHRTREIINAN